MDGRGHKLSTSWDCCHRQLAIAADPSGCEGLLARVHVLVPVQNSWSVSRVSALARIIFGLCFLFTSARGAFILAVCPSEYGNYVGAYLHDGMNDKVMIDIAYELHKSMPRVMKDHHMKEMWSYKYESSSNEDEERTGIHTHADDGKLFEALRVSKERTDS